MKQVMALALGLWLGGSPAARTGSFTDRLREKAAPIWEREMEHPFVRGLGDSSLRPEKFKFYIQQDYHFLIAYARVMALAASRAGDLRSMIRFSDSLSATLKTEMEMHRRFAASLGIGERELGETPLAPTTHAYTRHLLLVAETGNLAEIVAAVLPCAWGYYEIASRLAERGQPTRDPLYAEWIRTYASKETADYVAWLRELLDRLAEGAPERERARLEEHFLTSSRYELMFWEMAYREERWP